LKLLLVNSKPVLHRPVETAEHFGKFEMNLLKIAVFGESVFPCCGSVGIAAGEVVGFGILKQYSEVL
jgi:hypothetical protein